MYTMYTKLIVYFTLLLYMLGVDACIQLMYIKLRYGLITFVLGAAGEKFGP